MQVSKLVLVGLVVYLFLLTVSLSWVFLFFLKFSKGVKNGNLIKILNSVLKSFDENSKSLKAFQKGIEVIKQDNLLHIQKLGLVRFNPFNEMGGDQSFSIALLNGKDNGVVITGLHTRERTRVYVRDIKGGKSKHELSDEEKKALKIAQKR
ncbi:hypothetical protein A2686_02260 [Candidatus Woesebacteria bacterium RIFCSPHIGHO2_01_FULL_38_10]|uniref:DUF4446 domain-containing protein n=1 Tax=Candidatus Woesebacteria bacterium RIFCSPLOWO2_01_FULL_39_10b TaxID=1802517 RepID=A0A1F8B9S9_9BACT|nr:MAG: hypothetical protein A2686_02260 [Candidatus Woesebacteria bacterium RIFCSPHIGHO2_01_FULL_38_10]OGM60801.1 MAG: hypothetical protein A2892_02035 [Candidatus Woesebacteria bacterium RIFCSPLOWO2_01_FULL_39_10b]